jgi:hypothetical protein
MRMTAKAGSAKKRQGFGDVVNLDCDRGEFGVSGWARGRVIANDREQDVIRIVDPPSPTSTVVVALEKIPSNDEVARFGRSGGEQATLAALDVPVVVLDGQVPEVFVERIAAADRLAHLVELNKAQESGGPRRQAENDALASQVGGHPPSRLEGRAGDLHPAALDEAKGVLIEPQAPLQATDPLSDELHFGLHANFCGC